MSETAELDPKAEICTQNAPREVACKKRLETASPMYRPVLEKAYSGEASPRTAIKAFCLECVGYDRAAITNCSAPACPLWLYRPYQTEGV